MIKIIQVTLVMLTSSFAGAQGLQPLGAFDWNSQGAYPHAALIPGNDGQFYGTTSFGGSGGGGNGTLFKVATNGSLFPLAAFTGPNGSSPYAALVLGEDGSFYGTTMYGGDFNAGTVFKTTTNGVLTTLVSFTSANGANPRAALTLGNDGNYYGTTSGGGSTGYGTIFKITTNGDLTTLVSFANTNGANPRAALVLGNDGNYYGTTFGGGTGGYGTIFKLTTNGVLNTLVSFANTNGANPSAELTLGSDGNFYGTTSGGGSSGYGTIYKLTTNGVLNTLVVFTSTNGANPNAKLTLGIDGNFYGTTSGNLSVGACPYGSIFKVTTNGALTTLIFFNNSNGGEPYAALTVGSDGNSFFGTSCGGGPYGNVFRLSFPLITAPPQSQTNGLGATVTFSVSATCLSPASYQWQKDGTNLLDGGAISGTTNSTLEIAPLAHLAVGNYTVIVSNYYSSVTSSVAALAVTDLPVITQQPLSQTIAVGSNVTFSATTCGAPPFIMQWYYGNSAVGSPTVDTNYSSYTLINVQTNQSGNYHLQVINSYGSTTSSNAVLTVIAPPPTITTQPLNCTNIAGATATFSVTATGSGLNYQWQQNGNSIANGGKFSGVTTSNLTITGVSSNEAALYSVVVTNLNGSATSSNATLTVIYAPVITNQPTDQRQLLGSSALFNVGASGMGLKYQWRFNGGNLLNATNASYFIPVLGTNHTGNYSVVVNNLTGSVTSSNALLTVLVRPKLTVQFLGGYPLLNLNGMLSNNFVVQWNTNLTSTNWSTLLSLTNMLTSPYLFLDPAGGAPPGRFYRAWMQ